MSEPKERYRLSQRLLAPEEADIVVPKHGLSDIFEEEPVDLKTFIQDKKFLGMGDITLSDIQAEAVMVMERVLYEDIYPLMAKEFNSEYWAQEIPVRNLITLLLGKGSGKDLLARLGSLRVAYLLLCLKSPQRYFGLPDVDSIHMLNVAVNAPQAERAFFIPMRKAVERGWFKDKAHATRNSIVYDKNLEAISGHSDAEGQEGLNIIFGVADEIDAFKTKEEKSMRAGQSREASTSAESILDMIKSSASSRFPETYKRVALSYPRYLGSTIMKLAEEGRSSNKKYGDESQHYVVGPYATWEVNPRISGKEHYKEDYEKDPAGSAMRYECKPTRSSNSYFRNMDQFRAAVSEGDQPVSIDYELTTEISELNGTSVTSWKAIFDIDKDFKPVDGALYAVHADLAVVGDRAGVAMSHIDSYQEVTKTHVDSNGYHKQTTRNEPVVKNDFTIAFESDMTKANPRQIQIHWVRQLIYELIGRGFHIARVSYDQYQSQDSIQLLQKQGIDTERYSLDTSDDGYKTLRDLADTGRLKMPYSQLLLNEIEGLTKIGRKIDHPPNGSKDMSDALAGSVAGALEVGGSPGVTDTIVMGTREHFGASSDGVSGDEYLITNGYLMDLPNHLRGMSL